MLESLIASILVFFCSSLPREENMNKLILSMLKRGCFSDSMAFYTCTALEINDNTK